MYRCRHLGGKLVGRDSSLLAERNCRSCRVQNCTTKSSLLKVSAFEIGIGFGALYLLISSQREFQTLNKLLEQTEALVQQMKRHLQHHHNTLNSSSCSKSPNSYCTEIKTVSEQSWQNYNEQKGLLQQCSHTRNTVDGCHLKDHDSMRQVLRNTLDGYHLEDHDSMRKVMRNTFDGCRHPEDYDSMRKVGRNTLDGCHLEGQDFMVTEQTVENCEMSALEVELEAELELLELNLNMECCADGAVAYDSGEGDSKEDIGILHNDKLSCKMRDTADPGRKGRQSMHFGALSGDYGVSPFELDYRLREVLEAQQKEHILELEGILRETRTMLHSKEEEILYWKDRVHQLTKSVKPNSADGTDMPRFKDVSSGSLHVDYLYNTPEFTKNTLEVLGSFQDPPISSEINHVENIRNLVCLAEKRKHLSSSAIDVTTEVDKLPLFISDLSDTSSLCFEDSVDLVKVVTESHTSWHIQGAGIDTTNRSMEEIEVHTPLPVIPNIFRGQSVSRASEMSDCFQQDDLNSVVSRSCWDFCKQGNSTIGNMNNICSQYPKNISSFCSRSSSSKDMPCIEQNGNLRSKEMSDVYVHPCLTPLKSVLKGSKSRYQVMEDPSAVCNDSKCVAVEEKNYSDAKQTVDSGLSDLHLNTPKHLHSRTQSPLHIAAKIPRGSSKMKNETLQIVTTGLRRSESSIGITSPVLGKIRHWEAVGRGQSLENCAPVIIKTKNDGQNTWNQ